MKLRAIIGNKYMWVGLAFIVWVSFLDQNSLVDQYDLAQQKKGLETDKAYYLSQIQQNKKELSELVTNMESLEKFGREKYLMKKDNEEIFVFTSSDTLQK